MLALIATIAGSVVTGYSAYKIHTFRNGQGRKLRDMEVLRRLNIPPKKQVRVWSFIMALGLVLLTPGLGFLLSYDSISDDGGNAPYSNLRATTSGSPVVVPPSEKLDNTPRIVDKDESGTSGRTFFFASSGGGGSRKSSSGGSGTTSRSSSSENVTSTDETSSAGYDNDTLSSGGEDSTYGVSDINETAEFSETKLASSGPKIGATSEMTANTTAAESENLKSETETTPIFDRTKSAKIDAVPEKTSAEGASEPSEVAGKTELAPTEASTEPAIIDSAPEKRTVPDTSGYSVDGREPKSNPTETQTEPAIIKAAPEKRTAADTTGYSVVETLPESTAPETLTESAVIDIGPEKSTAVDTSEYSVAESVPESTPTETKTEPEVIESVPEKTTAPDTSGFSETGDEFESPSSTTLSEPSDSEVGSDLPETSPLSTVSDLGDEPDRSWLSSAIENPATNSISDPAAFPAEETESQIDEVKKLEFKEENTSKTNGTGNDSVEGTELANNLLPNLEGPFGDFETGPRLDTFGKGFDFDTEFINFTPVSRPEMGIDKNDTSSSVPIMEFEKMDLGSNFGGGFGLTPSSPFG